MTRRLLLGYLTITVLVLAMLEVPLAVVYSQRERDRITSAVEHDAYVLATVYEDALERGLPLDPARARAYAERTGARVVVLDLAAVSHVDTELDPGRNFSTRPEVQVALTGQTSSGTRSSETLGADLLYVAVPVASGGTVHGALRITLGMGEVNARIHRFWWALAAAAAVVLLAVALVGWAVARSVSRPIRHLNEVAGRFARGHLAAAAPDAAAATVSGPPEVRQLGETLVAMAGQLDELLRTQRRFVADASHQLRTPLTALRLRLENLQSRLAAGETGAAGSGELEAAVEETERLSVLVTDLLALTRADEPPSPVEVDLVPLVRDRVDTWSALAEGARVRLVAQLSRPSARVLAVPGAVEQILDNLLDNALNASPEGGRVTVSVDEVPANGGGWVLSIADEGPGLSAEQRVLARQRFWRGTSATPGTGLGLAIVDALAAASGATLALTPAEGGGLVASVTFPPTPRGPSVA